MSSVRGDLYTKLNADVALTALVGTRIYPLHAPASAAKPYVVIGLVSDVPAHHMGSATGLTEVRAQVDVFAATSVSLHAVIDAIRNDIDGFRGTIGAQANCRASIMDKGGDDYIPARDGSENGTFHGRIDLQLWHPESVPA